MTDTIKESDDGKTVSRTLERGKLWAVQTPQVFRKEWLLEAYQKRGQVGDSITDDAQLVEAIGKPVVVKLVRGGAAQETSVVVGERTHGGK